MASERGSMAVPIADVDQTPSRSRVTFAGQAGSFYPAIKTADGFLYPNWPIPHQYPIDASQGDPSYPSYSDTYQEEPASAHPFEGVPPVYPAPPSTLSQVPEAAQLPTETPATLAEEMHWHAETAPHRSPDVHQFRDFTDTEDEASQTNTPSSSVEGHEADQESPVEQAASTSKPDQAVRDAVQNAFAAHGATSSMTAAPGSDNQDTRISVDDFLYRKHVRPTFGDLEIKLKEFACGIEMLKSQLAEATETNARDESLSEAYRVSCLALKDKDSTIQSLQEKIEQLEDDKAELLGGTLGLKSRLRDIRSKHNVASQSTNSQVTDRRISLGNEIQAGNYKVSPHEQRSFDDIVTDAAQAAASRRAAANGTTVGKTQSFNFGDNTSKL